MADPLQRHRPPSVERLLAVVRLQVDSGLEAAAVTDAVRAVVAEERERLLAGAPVRPTEELASAVIERLDGFVAIAAGGPVAAINATGVIIHTNLGRAPWPEGVAAKAATLAADYGFLELDRETGRRGARFRQAEEHLIALTGAEDALVTNNNAAALALAVGLAGRGGVVVSRGELVEIGGGVRIPEIVRRAGAKLIEVGTTNRTRAVDFEAPLVEGRARAILRVHPSNFTMAGFTEAPDPSEVAGLAHLHGAIVIDDLGSGALIDTARFGLAHEPMPRERLAAGADVVTFSGDKLVGGPQAGLVVGRGELVARMRRDPLARAMRPDKVTLVGVALTLGLYRAGRALDSIPVWRMIAEPADSVRGRAEALAAQVAAVVGSSATDAIEVVPVVSTVGGGSLPGATLPSWAVALRVRSAVEILGRLRRGRPAVVARVKDGAVLLDLRTIRDDAGEELARAIADAMGPADRGDA